jgi:uncharacterized membrane protein YozB (DUF420 family)
MIPLSHFPVLNATLNAAASVLLITGYWLIRRGRREAHKRVMLAACTASVAFLCCYLIYHFQVGSVKFQGRGWIRTLYLTILGTHTILAASVPFLVIVTLRRAFGGDFRRHAKIARWTLPIWLYVSVTGVVVYFMLYRMPAHGHGQTSWNRHTIDDEGRGADGVKLADVNGDGLVDVVSAWEQAGEIRLYLNPGPEKARSRWPSVTVGKAASPEDAIFIDLDRDGAVDVVSFCEGKTKSMFVHWAPSDRNRQREAAAWNMEVLPASRDRMMWMFGQPLQVDGVHGVDIVAAGKLDGAAIGWFESPARPRDLGAWKWHSLRKTGWVMSIIIKDMDGDGDADILFSDRRGERSGVYWLENPSWTERMVGSSGREVMFIDYVDFDGDGQPDILAAVKPNEIHVHLRKSKDGRTWSSSTISVDANTGTAKAVRAADLDGDGNLELIVSAEHAAGAKSGVIYLERVRGQWIPRDISGAPGVKYDLMELVDLDDDGDLDILTTEEVDQLGVIWYENPARQARSR